MTTVLSFDDIDTSPNGIAAIGNGYGGLDWSNFFALDVTHNPEGYAAGATSGQQVALNGGGGQADVTLASGTFTIKTVEMTAAFDASLKVDIYGYDGATELFHKKVTLNDMTPTLVKLNFSGVTDVRFVPGHGQHDPAKGGTGKEIAFDDMSFGNIRGASAAPAHALDLGSAHAFSPMHVDLLPPHLHIV